MERYRIIKQLIRKVILVSGMVLFLFHPAVAQEADSLFLSRPLIHRIAVEGRPGYIFPTSLFLKGENEKWKPIRQTVSAHLKYSFQFHPDTYTDQVYGGVYQGIGLAYYSFGEAKQLGNPLGVYLFQGARIAQFNPRLSFNYEWNFGVTFNWKPYDYLYNPYNTIIGTKVNAYLNVNFYLNWILSRRFDLTTGVTLAHFSNGNTKFPNGGVNTVDAKLGLVYYFNRENLPLRKSLYHPAIQKFPRHVSYDLVLFGSWRRKTIPFFDEKVVLPDAYPVVGFNFAPMYNLGYRLRIGASLDGVYDGSANVYTEDYIAGTEQQFYKPSLSKQLALGLSGRIEYVMPYFTVGLGLGTNVLHGGGDLKGFY